MKYDFIIFGGTGLQGRICGRDLLESGYSVLFVGRDSSGIRRLLQHAKADFLRVDLSQWNSITNAIKRSGASVVVNCAELVFNIPIMKACLTMRRSCTDLGGLQYVTQEQFKLDDKFRQRDILCVTGCGSTPGISNVMTAHVLEDYERVDSIDLGFTWNSNKRVFVVPYSMQSIFDEFTQPPVLYRAGRFVKSDRVRCMGRERFRAVGKQTVYCIVHSEVYTFARYFKSKGVKNIHYYAGFPDHSLKTIQTLMSLGFNSREPVSVGNVLIKPIDFTAQVLKRIKPPQGYNEVENLWVRLKGVKNGKERETEIDCIVRTTKGWEDAGSNVGTGRTIAIMSMMIKEGVVNATGVHAPEGVIPHRAFIRELGKRQMYVYMNGGRIN